MKYAVGQVVFVIMAKKNQVYPMQVVEVISKKTLTGAKEEYLLQAGPDKNTTILLDKVDGEVFGDPKAVLEALTTRASTQIKKLVGMAVTKAGEWYTNTASPEELSATSFPDLDTPAAGQSEYETVTLPDGTVAKVKLPTASDVKYVGDD